MTKSIHQDAPHKNDLKTKIKINERSPDILPRSSSQLLKYSTNPEENFQGYQKQTSKLGLM